jgi:hypothetical protein
MGCSGTEKYIQFSFLMSFESLVMTLEQVRSVLGSRQQFLCLKGDLGSTKITEATVHKFLTIGGRHYITTRRLVSSIFDPLPCVTKRLVCFSVYIKYINVSSFLQFL